MIFVTKILAAIQCRHFYTSAFLRFCLHRDAGTGVQQAHVRKRRSACTACTVPQAQACAPVPAVPWTGRQGRLAQAGASVFFTLGIQAGCGRK